MNLVADLLLPPYAWWIAYAILVAIATVSRKDKARHQDGPHQRTQR